MKELKIKAESAIEAYKNTDDNGKRLLESLFGKENVAPKDIMDRVKTFDDAMNELGKEHPLFIEYNAMMNAQGYTPSAFVIAVMKLSVICAALNEGWKPEYKKGEYRYMPWFWLFTKKEYENMSEKDKQDCVLFGGHAHGGANGGLVCAYSVHAPSSTNAYIGSRLCLKSSTLARYCGKQFAEIWADFLF